MTEQRVGAGAIGAGRVPPAIAISPILSARYRPSDLDRIREAAPGSRLVMLSRDGLADGPLDDVEVLLRGWLSSEALERVVARAPRLAWIHSASAGVERVLTPAVLGRSIVVTNARGVFSGPIAEYVVMMLLAVSRRLPQLLELQRERTWQPLEGREMRDVTVGIVGLGSIGRAVGDLAAALGCRVIATRRNPSASRGEADHVTSPPNPILTIGGPEALPELLGQSDFVVLTVPLTPETENLIDEAALAAFMPGSWLINVARGRLIDERALLRALQEGRIGGAVLDTVREEPLQPGSPFYDLPNVILTPHTSWSSGRVLDRSIELFCRNMGRFVAGQTLHNLVDPRVGY
jgi:phosphoglycerate dehydrogenase-like enzyme